MADIGRRGSGGQVHISAAGVGQGLSRVPDLLQATVALGDLLDGLPAGSVSDEQAEISDIGQLAGHGLQPGEIKVADGKARRLAARQDPPDVIKQLLVAIVYDVVGHGWLR